ncbi:acyltransferase family protein [Rhodococcus koreensis]|uniref:acyltransferase family protein n=1 Tax=Rhodococcus koreensis TaxID=99653 RepID=UPI0036DB13B8
MVTALHPGFKRTRRRSTTREHTAQKRRDIQGLRMVAVMLVVLDHLFEWPRGGFIGVDVFFVISGFLITGQLLKSLDCDGRVSFSDFYRKRLRRIFPAATLVIVSTIAASYSIFSASRFTSTAVDGAWAFAFVANWRFGMNGTDYFQAGGPVSPFQHYWSLSVEEQFYVVWPVVILLIGIVAARKSLESKARTIIAASVMGAVIAVSFGFALIQSSSEPTWAYFSTFTRVWELGVGALLAICIGAFDRIPHVARPYLAWAGLLAIALSAFTITESSGFPAPAAALPVLGVALVIGSGTAGGQRFLRPLSNRVSVYIGDISYSLYLWHWPVIVLLGSLMVKDAYFYVAALGLMFAFAVASYHYFENPIRHSSWLLPTAQKVSRPKASRPAGKRLILSVPKLTDAAQNAGLASLTLLAVGLTAYVVRPAEVSAVPDRRPAVSLAAAKPAAEEVKLGPAGTAFAQQIEAAVAATEWPDLNPSMDEAITGPQASDDVSPCGMAARPDPSECTWGSPSAPKTMMLLGDSVAMSFLGPLKAFAESSDGQWKVRNEAMFGCAFVDIEIRTDGPAGKACPGHKADAIRAVNEVRPDVVVITNLYVKSPDEWIPGMRRLTDQFAANVGKIVFLSATPDDVNVGECYTPTSKPANCISRVRDSWRERSGAEEILASAINAQFIDTRRWFCTADDYCPSFVGTTPMRKDAAHITPAYGKLIAPVVAETLRSAGL